MKFLETKPKEYQGEYSVLASTQVKLLILSIASLYYKQHFVKSCGMFFLLGHKLHYWNGIQFFSGFGSGGKKKLQYFHLRMVRNIMLLSLWFVFKIPFRKKEQPTSWQRNNDQWDTSYHVLFFWPRHLWNSQHLSYPQRHVNTLSSVNNVHCQVWTKSVAHLFASPLTCLGREF